MTLHQFLTGTQPFLPQHVRRVMASVLDKGAPRTSREFAGFYGTVYTVLHLERAMGAYVGGLTAATSSSSGRHS
jgi:hypothetical protein